MSMAAAQAARVASSGGISTTTMVVIGLGTFCVANPEKALQLLQRALLTLSDGGRDDRRLSNTPQQPIVIHAGPSSAAGGPGGGSGASGFYYAIIQLGVGAGLCWGSYALLVNVLPEQAKNMLPVTQGTFKAAVTSLGKGLLHVKDTLSGEIAALLAQQSDLSHKQDETHEQVLYVQEQVADVHDDLHGMQNSLDDCHAALQTTDKRTTYIAKGIRLVTQGMTAMLPPDDALVQELRSFQKTSHGNGETAAAVPRNKIPSQQEERRRVPRPLSDGGSHSTSSRRSRQERSRSRNSSSARRNKPPVTTTVTPPRSSNDTLSVSTGTPVRHVVVHKNKKNDNKDDDDSTIVSHTGVKELDDVRQLLERMDQQARLAL